MRLVEADQRVVKAEGPAAAYSDWWAATAPPAPAGGGDQEPQVQKQDGAAAAGSREAAEARWVLAQVGLAAQAAITRQLQGQQSQHLNGTTADPPRVHRADDGAGPGPAAGVSAVAVGPDSPQAQALADEAIEAVYGAASGGAGGAGARGRNGGSGDPRADPAAAARALWNLDRADQKALPLDGRFAAPATGRGVTIYTVDSGVNADHQEFDGGRASVGPDFLAAAAQQQQQQDQQQRRGSNPRWNDCDGHGTHVASTAVGRAVGVASGARVVALRVLDCDGSGAISDVVAALDWVAANAARPAVVTLSLGVPAGNWSAALEAAVRAVSVNAGIPVIVAAGNNEVDACSVAPASVAEAITVAATNLPAKFASARPGGPETLYSFGNFGACVDILAPGVDIFAACAADKRCGRATNRSYTFAAGTSMAVPHVAAAAALYLETRPRAAPAEVKAALVEAATRGAISLGRHDGDGTPNLLMYVGRQGQGGGGVEGPNLAAYGSAAQQQAGRRRRRLTR